LNVTGLRLDCSEIVGAENAGCLPGELRAALTAALDRLKDPRNRLPESIASPRLGVCPARRSEPDLEVVSHEHGG
jgi:hypothetical protein